MKPGTGKTFCTAYASTALNTKVIIITPNDAIKSQWIATYKSMFDYKEQDVLNITGSGIITAIVNDRIKEADVYFVNHQTLQSYLSQTSYIEFHDFFKKIKVGIKVFDESHQYFLNVLTVDFFTDTERTWYLTATFDRSDKSESKCFQKAFSTVVSFNESEADINKAKHVMYHIVYFNSRITPYQLRKVIGWQGLTSVAYGKYAFFDDPNDSAYEVIKIILEKIKDVEGKILIFIPLIDAIDIIVKKIKMDFPDKSVMAYHSKVDRDEKESVSKRDIIVSTIKSTGTGKDIPGLRCVICAEPVASKVLIEQMIGRLRQYAEDKDTYYFDIVDNAIMALGWWLRGRLKKIVTLVKDVIYLNIDQ
jgi:superfamily II DNA or RNA helicase